MRSSLKLLLGVLYLTESIWELNTFRPKTVRIYQFTGTCPGYENVTIYYTNIELFNVNRVLRISMKIHIRSPINNDFKVLLYLSRCTSRDALDSCETYNTIKMSHFCKLLNAENKPWTAFINGISNPMRCPLKKGVYEVKNSTFDGSAFGRLPVLGWYWKILVNARDEVTNELLHCSYLEAQITPI